MLRARAAAMVQPAAVAIAGAKIRLHRPGVADVDGQQDALAIGMPLGHVSANGFQCRAAQSPALSRAVDEEAAERHGARREWMLAKGGSLAVYPYVTDDVPFVQQGQCLASRTDGHIGQGIANVADEGQLLGMHGERKYGGAQCLVDRSDMDGRIHAGYCVGARVARASGL